MRRAALVMLLGFFAVTGTAAADPPTATTGAATAVTATTVTLTGTVDPNKEATTYWFEYGTSTGYGSQTAPADAGPGNAPKAVSSDVSGLAPSTTYHFRLVARNASGTVAGADATFTAGQPGVTIAAAPRIVRFGRQVTISGAVPGNAGVKVELEQTPFPFTDPFTKVADGTTDAAANYSFLASPALNTRYHVEAKASPPVTSADMTVLVRPKVGLRLSDRRPARGARVRFKGSVLPAHDGSRVRIQRKTRAGWKTLATPLLAPATPLNGVARSRYARRLRVNRSGTYRTVLPTHDDHARGKSRRRHVHVH